MAVSIVIPTWNGRHLLEHFFPSAVAAASRHVDAFRVPVEIVVVDDGSTDETASWVAERAARSIVTIRIVSHPDNRGFGAACNLGVREAAFPLVWLLNNDVDVPADAIETLSAPFAEADETLFAVHSRMVDYETNREVGTGKMGGFARGFLRVHRSYVTRPDASGPFWSMFASGGSAIFHRAHFLALGGFDPLFAPFYMEDVELSYRAWKRGLTVRYQPRCGVRHRFSSTIGPTAGSQVERISQRNRLLFHWIHLHDGRYLVSHGCWILILLLTTPFTPKRQFLGAFKDAAGRLSAIRARRREERRHATRSDREVLKMFQEMEAKGEIRPYDDAREIGL